MSSSLSLKRPFSPALPQPVRPSVEEAPEMQSVKRAKAPAAAPLVLVMTPSQNHYCGFAIQEAAQDFHELPVTSGVEKVNAGFVERCDKVAVYLDEGSTQHMRDICSLAARYDKLVQLRLLQDSNYTAWCQSARAMGGSATASSCTGQSELGESNSGKSA